MDRVVSIIGFDLAEGKWIAYCVHYDLYSGHAELRPSWEQLIELCESYLDWCLEWGVRDIVSTVTPQDEKQKTHLYEKRQLADGIAELEGRLLLDSIPKDWGNIDAKK